MEAAPAKRHLMYRWWFAVIGIFALALAWRVALINAMPTLARDGVKYCWYARDLGRSFVATVRESPYQQHPLFPAAVLGAERLLVAAGWDGAEPETWELAGHIVALLSGLAVIALVGWMTARIAGLVRRIPLAEHRAARWPATEKALLALSPRWVAFWAMLLTAMLPENHWLGADVLSDAFAAMWYLAAIIATLYLPGWRAAAMCGVCGGLAFLTRPEGAVACLAGGVVLLAQLRRRPIVRTLAQGVGLTATFLAVAGPYMWTIGAISPKQNKGTIERFEPQAAVGTDSEISDPASLPRLHASSLMISGTNDTPLLAMLVRERLGIVGAALRAGYETARAGKVFIVLWGLPIVVLIWRLGRGGPTLGPVIAGGAHFALTVLLQYRHGYLEPRHTIVVVLLLTPSAAIGMLLVAEWARKRWGGFGRAAIIGMTLLPLWYYGQRVPNGADGFLREAADWIRVHEPDARGKVLLTGSTERRLAFYADMQHQMWPEWEPTHAARAAGLFKALRTTNAEFFAITTGAHAPRTQHAALRAMVEADAAVAARLTPLADFAAPNHGRIYVYRIGNEDSATGGSD